MKFKLISLLAAAAFIGVAAQAQDKALLETLVKKGMLSKQEAAQIAKESVAVAPSSSETKSIKIKGGVTGWYEWSQVGVDGGDNLPESNGFTMRYVKVGLEAEIGGGWTVDVTTDFGTEGQNRNYLDNVTISKRVDYDSINGTVDFGFKKVNFGLEQTQDDFKQLAIERSIATWFFTRPAYIGTGMGQKDFASRNTGIFWNGEIKQLEGLYYGLAVTGGMTEQIYNNTNDNNKLSFYANMGYKNYAEVNGEGISYDFGLNYGYASGGVQDSGHRTYSVWGLNPYVSAKWRGLTAMVEYFFQQIENSKASGEQSSPQGWNVTIAWKQDLGEWGAIEPVFRFSCLSTNGNKYNSSYGISYNGGTGTYFFDSAQTYYIGANWYVVPSVKFSLGYEYMNFEDGGTSRTSTDGSASGNSVRAQLQVVF